MLFILLALYCCTICTIVMASRTLLVCVSSRLSSVVLPYISLEADVLGNILKRVDWGSAVVTSQDSCNAILVDILVFVCEAGRCVLSHV